MSQPPPSHTTLLPIERHGLIGDRRTGALVASDGTLDWFCAPAFDGAPVFGLLLDPTTGGFCRVGPESSSSGSQHYEPDTMVLNTSWAGLGLELSDVMAQPGERTASDCKHALIIRRLRAVKKARASFAIYPRHDFRPPREMIPSPEATGARFRFEEGNLCLWTSFPLEFVEEGARAMLTLGSAEEHWMIIGWDMPDAVRSARGASALFDGAREYWQRWSSSLTLDRAGQRRAAVARSALIVQTLGHADHDCAVAALTTSLPERIGGDRNYDYRLCWVRDGSLALALLARLGKTREVKRHLEWMCSRKSNTRSPLQVCYRLDGGTDVEVRELTGVRGYRDSRPVTVGNRAAQQRQLGQLGFFADCVRIYFDAGGEWHKEFWDMLTRAADFVCATWQEPDSGIWELEREANHVASRVMGWVVLQRAIHIGKATGKNDAVAHWEDVSRSIHAEVMDQGWSERKQAFRQCYGSDALDASALLIPLMDFLPVDHPRVVATLQALERELVVDGLMHRFDPQETFGHDRLPIGQFEGAFLPCVFWHAHVLAKAGDCARAEAILQRCEAIAGAAGLFSEEVDAHHDSLLGNTPLLFSHVEYVRAIMQLHDAHERRTRTSS